MGKLEDDVNKVGEVLFHFFKTKRIMESLDAIHEMSISGWEKWW